MKKRLSKTLQTMAEVCTSSVQAELLKDCARKARELEWQDDVRDFHLKFEHEVREVPSAPPSDDDWWTFRRKLIEEEVDELLDALESRKLPAIAQEAVDVIVVVTGTCVGLGIRLAPVWRAVHRANMSKEPRGRGRKPGKPAGWKKPDFARILANQTPPRF